MSGPIGGEQLQREEADTKDSTLTTRSVRRVHDEDQSVPTSQPEFRKQRVSASSQHLNSIDGNET